MVEIIPKKAPELSGWLNFLFYLSLALAAFIIAVFFVFNVSIKNSQKTLADLETNLLKQSSPESIALKAEILAEQRKIKDFSSLISRHLSNLPFFDFIGKKSHPKVWFSGISVDARNNTVSLSGESQSFEALGQQLIIFQQENLVKNVKLEKVSIGERGKVAFSLTLSLDPKIFSPGFSLKSD